MKLSQIGEFGLIELIRKREKARRDTVVGIGDDCAVLKIPSTKLQISNNTKYLKSKNQKYLLITTDALVEFFFRNIF